jgi:hypothetical protein
MGLDYIKYDEVSPRKKQLKIALHSWILILRNKSMPSSSRGSTSYLTTNGWNETFASLFNKYISRTV